MQHAEPSFTEVACSNIVWRCIIPDQFVTKKMQAHILDGRPPPLSGPASCRPLETLPGIEDSPWLRAPTTVDITIICMQLHIVMHAERLPFRALIPQAADQAADQKQHEAVGNNAKWHARQ